MEKVNDLAASTQNLYRITNKKVVQRFGDFPVNDLQPRMCNSSSITKSQRRISQHLHIHHERSLSLGAKAREDQS